MKTYEEIKIIVDSFLDDGISTDLVEDNQESFPTVIERIQLEEQKKESMPIGTWGVLTDALGGLRPNEFTILCGPSGYGKTTFLANIAAYMISQQQNVFIASIEIGSDEFAKKMFSAISGIPANEIPSDKSRDFLKKNKELFFYNESSSMTKYTSRVNHRHLIYDLYWAFYQNGIKVAFIDNINYLLDMTQARNPIEAMDKAVHEFIVAVKHLDIHLFMVMHPRKANNGDDRVDSMYDIKGSSTAIQEAQNVLLFNKLSEGIEPPIDNGLPIYTGFCRELTIAKCRYNGRRVGSKIIYYADNNSEAYYEDRIV